MRPTTSGRETEGTLARVEERLRGMGAGVLRVDGFDFSQQPLVFASRFDLDAVIDMFGPLIGIWYLAPLAPAEGFEDHPSPVGYLVGHVHQEILYQWEVLAEDYEARLQAAGVALPKMRALGSREAGPAADDP